MKSLPTSENRILHAKSQSHYWEGPGPLSIKTFSNGKAHYKAAHGFFAVEEQSYLLLNEGPYTINIESDTEVESFCLFFREGFAKEVEAHMNAASSQLLDDPNLPIRNSVEFFGKTYPHDPTLSLRLKHLKNHYGLFGDDPLWREEQFYGIMQAILAIHRKVLTEVDSLPALRFSTREEIYRRVSVAYDYIQACFDRPITLNEIASVACMSPNHLLRNYRQVFGRTPYQQLSEKRLQEAKRLLVESDENMTEITFRVGFEAPSSFNKMFKQHTGMSPSQFRKR